MSKSRSATPKPNLRVPATSHSPSSSRTPTNDPTTTTAAVSLTRPSTNPSGEISPIHQQLPHVHSFVSSQTSPKDHPRPSPEPSSPRMAKRMRRNSPDEESSDSESRHDEHQSRSSSEASRSPQAQAPLPLKKKRTRTLTTPHQSAVLHALLAQSRFPTTAMREEVGRAIGLSARKVQIWFQNQRQKARRPGAQQQQQSQSHTQSGVLASQPYPTYPNLLAPVPGAFTGQPPFSGGFPLGALDTSQAQLLGPGIPGPSTTAPRQRGRPVLHVSPTDHHPRERPSLSPYSAPPRSRSGLEDSLPSFRPRQHDPARTLPPLDFTHQPMRRSDMSPSSYLLGGSAPPTPFGGSPPDSASTSASFRPSPPGLSRSRSPSPQFAHNLPPPGLETQLPSYSSTVLGLPPPFTLQPQPQWASHRPPSRPDTSSSWSQTRVLPLASLQPTHDDDDNTPRLEAARPPTASSSRVGRYDPVRGGFVPTGTPSPPA
ncbi:Homeobox protein OTX1 [Mycena indigotica]|uniref:Homeobox protein OTX1 n=1 Tax=Mycena indigotica TaxID=2126181 RepID=A0A8H6S1P3_9AGAR|nr:Homeobox protein OTX1 [Mycena indigotica]KAF7290812.1 Homeobox protein OTX1 [Mycena indigotica]